MAVDETFMASVQVCPRPEVVEVWDVTSPDPRLLVWLKVTHTYCWAHVAWPPTPASADAASSALA